MTSRKRLIRTRVAIGVVLVVSALPAALAQGRRSAGPVYRPAAGAKDLRSVLFNWTWALAMLRGQDEHELVASLEYQGKGTIQADGQPCMLAKYRISNNYQTSGERIPYTCTGANEQMYSNIENVSPMAAAVQERLIRLWAAPQGAAKAALVGVTDPPVSGANPGQLVDPKKASEATYTGYPVGRWEGDGLVLDSISFVDTTWFGRGGYFHSADLHVVEKTHAQGQ